MYSKKSILQKAEAFLTRKGSFAYRLCTILTDGEFNGLLSSHDLVHLLNEGPGKKIKVSNLTAQMEALLTEGIIKVKTVGKGRNKKKYWFPAWIDKEQIESQLRILSTDNNIQFFTGKDSWTDPNKNFPRVIQKLKGDLCIVDPFYGNGTFYVLAKFGKKRKIRFLSCSLGREEQNNRTQFEINLKKFKKEFKNIKMRQYNKPYELHDRYIIAENALVIVGHGIKDLADKECFVIFLPKHLVVKFLPILKRTFEKRWAKANNLK